MKKIILFLAILSVGFISSCSKDDSNDDTAPTPNPDNVFTAKVNGVQKIFTVSNVKVLEYPGYTDIEITAQIGNDLSNTFELNLSRNSGEIYFAQYLETGSYYSTEIPTAFPVVISENSNDKFSGTFSGTLEDTDNTSNTLTVTEGHFELYF